MLMDCGAIITAHLTNNPMLDVPIQRFSAVKEPCFYLPVEDRIKKRAGPVVEAILLAEYLFRYDRGGFWVGASAFN